MPQPKKTADKGREASREAKGRKAMGGRKKYRLLVGIHVGQDYSQEPTPLYDPVSREQVGEKYPSKTFTKGDVFESEADLLKMGEDKFALVQDEREPYERTFDAGQVQFPGGQVSSGLPQATSGTPGQALKQPESPEELPAVPPDLRREQEGGGQQQSGTEEELAAEEDAEETKESLPGRPAAKGRRK